MILKQATVTLATWKINHLVIRIHFTQIYNYAAKKNNIITRLTSNETLGQYDTSRAERLGQAEAISRNASSLTRVQDDISKDANNGQVIAADRMRKSPRSRQDDKSNTCSWGQYSFSRIIVLCFRDNVWSRQHLYKYINNQYGSKEDYISYDLKRTTFYDGVHTHTHFHTHT